MQIGIRLHDVNTALGPEMKTMEARAHTAAEEGFSCVHLALAKVIQGTVFDGCALTEGLGMHVKRVFRKEGLDIAVLGCYLNLANPDPVKLAEMQERYYGSMRVAKICGAGMVGTETGAPNVEYKYDAATHGKEALQSFIRGLEPVVECAENYGMTMAIEPVWKHIVWNPDRALEVIKSIGSRNLRIIFDPVNLLAPENIDVRDHVIGDAIEKLGDHIAMVHLKDFVLQNGDLKSVAAGTGGMDYREILRFMKARKPFIQATLENTDNSTAVSSREFLEQLYAEV